MDTMIDVPPFLRTGIVWGLGVTERRSDACTVPEEFGRRAVELAREGDRSIRRLCEGSYFRLQTAVTLSLEDQPNSTIAHLWSLH